MNMSSDTQYRQIVLETVMSPGFRRATFGGAVRGEKSPWIRMLIRAVEIRGERSVQFSYFDSKKDVTKNYSGSDVARHLGEVIDRINAELHGLF